MRRLWTTLLFGLILGGIIHTVELASETTASVSPSDNTRFAARYQTRQRTSNFFMRSRISSVRGA